MSIELLCRKIGMTRIFDEKGEAVTVTVLTAGPNYVVQKKTEDTDGYVALQLGFGEKRRKVTTRPQLGHFDKAKVAPQRHLHESRVSAEDAAKYEVGQELRADVFTAGQTVDVIGTSKGRGTAGVVKRHHFSMQKWTHGTHEGFRSPGSIGPGTWPAHVIKGLRMAGRMGNEQVTVRNLVIARIDLDANRILIRGAVPGANDGLVRVRAAIAPR
ncbi:MAG: 50S ribosomal protein L3 [Myxococcota bacterium]|nr:50S ribosomal protein L3 [Myxococcota bacterium]